MNPVIERIEEAGCCQLGEGPHWDSDTQSLYFVDCVKLSVNKYVPSTKQFTTTTLEKFPTFVIPVKDTSDRFVISSGRDICVITWDGVSRSPSNFETIGTVDTDSEGEHNILNDGKVDANGNLWAGTLNSKVNFVTGLPRTGSMYSMTKKQIKKHFSGVSCSNGLAWSKCTKKFYYIDSSNRTVDQFDYNHQTLTLSNRQTLFSLEKHGIPGVPDGMTIDLDGNLWVAVFQGNQVLNINTKEPESLLRSVHMPESLITSVCFGGKNLDELYVTTGGTDVFVIKDEKLGGVPTKPIIGGLYKITGLGVKGLPAERFPL
ncbi:hypothetical protein FQR65_LT08837 [Abscondita terminalis]|nr:hypothetical protein FQR65_LT08837 [Abscondita terminalis]